jgi:hypothetical protein
MLNRITLLALCITGTDIFLVFFFNIYIKIINEDETYKNTTGIERSTRKLEYI